jgi:hypothetical protein
MHGYILGIGGRATLISPLASLTQAERASGVCWTGCWVEPGADLSASA